MKSCDKISITPRKESCYTGKKGKEETKNMHLFQKKQDGTAVAAPQKKKKKIVLVVILVIVIVIGVIAGALKKMTAQVESVANTV